MFEGNNSFMTDYLTERALDAESLRKKVIANNIANVDTPHFKRSEVNFESELKRTIEARQSESENQFPGIMTHEKHIPFYNTPSLTGVSPKINLDYNTTLRNDGNNVDVEKEMVDASKNLMRYNALVSGLTQNYRVLKMAMRTA